MTTVRSHLKAMHTAHADFHARAAAAHMNLSKCFGKMDMEGAADLSDAHEELAKAHTDAGDYSVECAKTLDASNKAAGMGDGDALVPILGISSVYKMDNTQLRAIPRTGAPDVVDVSAVQPQFRKLVSTDDDEEFN